jgi:hypothetical protein
MPSSKRQIPSQVVGPWEYQLRKRTFYTDPFSFDFNDPKSESNPLQLNPTFCVGHISLHIMMIFTYLFQQKWKTTTIKGSPVVDFVDEGTGSGDRVPLDGFHLSQVLIDGPKCALIHQRLKIDA